MTVVENHGDDAFLARLVPRLLVEPLDEIAKSAEIQSKWIPLRDAHLGFVEKVREKSEERDKVVFVDLTEAVIDVAGKFVTYALFPKSVYSVMVSRGKTRCKVSVGYNPWSGSERTHDISRICQRYGGGGHAVVGAIALAATEIERARQIGLEITAELNS
jgi:nanoRNase/pAp phosphatase (c-di-AMP/oligoRNAs hydrolase)